MYRSSVFLYKGLYKPSPITAPVSAPLVPTNRTLAFILPALIAPLALAAPVAPVVTPLVPTNRALHWQPPEQPQRPSWLPPQAAPTNRPLADPTRPLQWLPAEIITPSAIGPPLAPITTPFAQHVRLLQWLPPSIPQRLFVLPPSAPPTGAPLVEVARPLIWLPPEFAKPQTGSVLVAPVEVPRGQQIRLLAWEAPPLLRWYPPYPFPDDDRGATPRFQVASPLFYVPPNVIPGNVLGALDDRIWVLGTSFLFVADNWPRSTFQFRVHMRAVSGTTYVRLFDVTDTVSVVEMSTTSNSFAFITAATATLIDAHEYRVEFGSGSGFSGEWNGLITVFMV